MNKQIENIITKNVYTDALIYIRKIIDKHPNYFFSVFAYGSVCRTDLIPGKSDIDLMVITMKDYLTCEVMQLLEELRIYIHKNFHITLHIRVRNIGDIKNKSSGLYDCGFTSAINKLRDSVLLFGKSLDPEYYYSIKNSSDDEILNNILIRFSELRYRIRSVINTQIDNYKLGSIIVNTAELICYAQGCVCLNSTEICNKAAFFSKNNLYRNALKIKTGDYIENYHKVIPLLDKDISFFRNSINIEKLSSLREKIIVHFKNVNILEKEINYKKNYFDKSERLIICGAISN